MTKKQFRKGKLAAVFMAAVLAMTGISGCGSQMNTQTQSSAEARVDGESRTPSKEKNSQAIVTSASSADMEFSNRDKDGSYSESDAAKINLNGSQVEADGKNVNVSGNTVTITGEGTYVISGTLDEGQIIVDAQKTDKVQIVLKDAKIHCETSAAFYVKNADKVFLTLAEGSENELSGGTEYQDIDDNSIDGVVFSKEDLTVNGSGSLTIDANYKNGIVVKDTLAITGGTITIDAVSQCLSGKDGIKILDGQFLLTTKGKALKSNNNDDTTLGNIYVTGGNFVIDSEDDAFHASGSIVIDGGTFAVESGDDAFHADQDMEVNDGTIKVASSYEGLEGYRIIVNGGDISIIASDDGVNAANPDSSSDQEAHGTMPMNGQRPEGSERPERSERPEGEQDGSRTPQEGTRPDRMGIRGGSMENDTNAYIKITGGTLNVDAQGDGIDSNGSLQISGGTTYVSGSVDGRNSAIDYNGDGVITGGIVIAAGNSRMAQGFLDSSTQYSILHNLDANQEAGTTITLTDKDGNCLGSFTPQKQYSSVVVSCPELKEGETYTLTAGTENAELTLNSMVTSNSTQEKRGHGSMGPQS